MELTELYERYRQAKAELNSFVDKVNISHDGVARGEDSETLKKWTEDEEQRRRELDSDVKQAADEVLGHPDAFDRVRCWMVDAVGKNDLSPSDEKMETVIEEMTEDAAQENTTHEYVERFGANLAANVRKVMKQFRLTDSGGGCGGWHLGCHCTEAEARLLCQRLYYRFGKAIKAGHLKVVRHHWSIRLIVED